MTRSSPRAREAAVHCACAGGSIRLRAFIAEKNPAAAQRISQQLIRSIRSLVDQPFVGHEIESHDIELAGVQEWVAGDYVVHYVVQDDLLTVLQVWHGREDRA